MNEDLLFRLEREGLKLAGFGKRILAFLIDEFILSFVIIAIFFDKFVSAIQTGDTEGFVLYVQNFSLSLIALQVLYHALFVYFYGATLGKIVCKIAVVDQALLDKPNLLQAFTRAIFRQLSSMAFFLGFVWAFGNNLRKTWQDFLAKTVVIELA